MKKPLAVIVSLLITFFTFGQQKFWNFESELSVLNLRHNVPKLITPGIYRTLSLPFDQYKAFLNTAPLESLLNLKNGLVISLPYPDNSFKNFRIVETKMMEAALSAQFPQIKTYVGQGIDDPAASVRIDYTAQGFHAYVLSPSGTLFIDPYQKANNDLYITYFSKDYIDIDKNNFKCKFDSYQARNAGPSVTSSPLAGSCIGTELRTYRAAISCTGQYARAVCPPGNVTVANTISAIVTTMNRVNGIYQTGLDIKMVLVGAEASVVYIDSVADPYNGNNDVDTLIVESQRVIDSAIGTANYDIGHTFSTGEGGLADLSVVCKGGKAKGVTGLPKPFGDAYDVDFVAHEMGHQFGAQHTFESELVNCNGNRSASSAYEVGSGTTIMAYAGICGNDNLQLHSDPYFHSKSFDQIVSYTTGSGSTCADVNATGNHSPVVIMPVSGIKIPKGTPFTLSASATDADGDALTYSWEQWDKTNLSMGSKWNSGDTTASAPLFKARIPKISGSRTFPDMSVILANYPALPSDTLMGGLKGETLPKVARDINFRFVARDNNAAGGGVATGGNGCSSAAVFKIVVTNDGPFKLTAPNSAVNWMGGSVHDVKWNVVNTNNAGGINVQNVDILMSTDGGLTYPTTIVSNVTNNGIKSISVPNIPTNTKVRFMVKAAGNIFFDISDVNFTITFSAVLPISLLQFSAEPILGTIVLKWSTATESNSKGFKVLRSEANSQNFVQIGFVQGAVNSTGVLNYSLTDKAVKKGVVYFYRLQQIDINNNTVFSEIRRAKLGITGVFSASIQPLPFHNSADLYVDGIESKNFKIIISDVTGRIVQKKVIKNEQESRLIPLDFNTTPSGVYFIKILQDNVSTTLRAVKL